MSLPWRTPAAFAGLQIKAVVDDGAIFYLNGHEIYRDGMPADPISMTTPATTNRSGTAETQINTFDVTASGLQYLQAGNNVLAVEVHNYSLGTTFSA
jgi:hypothetical protein